MFFENIMNKVLDRKYIISKTIVNFFHFPNKYLNIFQTILRRTLYIFNLIYKGHLHLRRTFT